MRCKTLTIKTDGTSANTQIIVDGEVFGKVQRVEFLVNVNDQFVNVLIEIAKTDSEGKALTKKIKIRDPKTQKFIDGEKVITEPISLEFNV